MNNFEGNLLTPGIQATLETEDTVIHWERAEHLLRTGVVISGAARDAGNSTTTILRAGLLLGRITASGKWKEWNPTGTDGSQMIQGILEKSLNMQRMGANADRYLGNIYVAGPIKATSLIIPGAASAGISGAALEYSVRAQMRPRFLFDDDFVGNAFGGFGGMEAKLVDYAVLAADNNKVFTNDGALGAVNFTLPVTPSLGLRYVFYAATNQNLVITAGAADTMIVLNDIAADSVALQTANEIVGGSFEVIGNGTKWLVIPRLWEAQTVTIVT